MKRLQLLDYSRFIAAIMVVLYHYTFNGIENGKISTISHDESLIFFTKYGYLGVELFFMISGYVIFKSATGRTASEFAVGRATRLYPAYWFAVLFTSCFAFFWGGELMSTSILRSIANLSMLQSFFNISHVDGVYWTLVYEITFYFAVFITLLVGLQQHLVKIFQLWPFILGIALILNIDYIPLLGGYYYYFAAGAIFAVLKQKYSLLTIISLSLSYFLCLQYSMEKAATFTQIKGTFFSELVIAIIVSVFFLIFILQNIKKIQEIELPQSKLLGSLTYPVYLIHAHFGYMLINKFANEQNKLVITAITLIIVIIISYIIHSLIERKYAHIWSLFFNRLLVRPINEIQIKIGKLPILFRD